MLAAVEAAFDRACALYVEWSGVITWHAGAAIDWHHDANRRAHARGSQGAPQPPRRGVLRWGRPLCSAWRLPRPRLHPLASAKAPLGAARATRTPYSSPFNLCSSPLHHRRRPATRPYLAQRAFSAVVYLSGQGAHFGGGALAFASGEPRAVEPAAGRLAAYSAGPRDAHRVEPVEWGARRTLALWFTEDPSHAEDPKARAALRAVGSRRGSARGARGVGEGVCAAGSPAGSSLGAARRRALQRPPELALTRCTWRLCALRLPPPCSPVPRRPAGPSCCKCWRATLLRRHRCRPPCGRRGPTARAARPRAALPWWRARARPRAPAWVRDQGRAQSRRLPVMCGSRAPQRPALPCTCMQPVSPRWRCQASQRIRAAA